MIWFTFSLKKGIIWKLKANQLLAGLLAAFLRNTGFKWTKPLFKVCKEIFL
jgi:predicted membrane metal-binding protein